MACFIMFRASSSRPPPTCWAVSTLNPMAAAMAKPLKSHVAEAISPTEADCAAPRRPTWLHNKLHNDGSQLRHDGRPAEPQRKAYLLPGGDRRSAGQQLQMICFQSKTLQQVFCVMPGTRRPEFVIISQNVTGSNCSFTKAQENG